MKNRILNPKNFVFLIFSLILYLQLTGCSILKDKTGFFQNLSAEKNVSSEDISPKTAYEMIEKNDTNLVILDVRTKEEFDEDHIANSIHYDFYSKNFEKELYNLDREKTYIVYCRVGRRSGLTVKTMQKMGFKTMYNVEGGIIKWKENSLPVVKN